MTVLYAMMHLLVDGICAFAMLGKFCVKHQNYAYFLIYNFCAFALQFPIGLLLDTWNHSRKNKYSCWIFAFVGFCMTVLGAFTNPFILGLGNAFFHVGAGVESIETDRIKGWKGRGLGFFVAPGAVGLLLGRFLANTGFARQKILCFFVIGVVLICLCFVDVYKKKDGNSVAFANPQMAISTFWNKQNMLFVFVIFFIVVVRTYVGFMTDFHWNKTTISAAAVVFIVFIGKLSGGFLSAKWGDTKTLFGLLLWTPILLTLGEYWFLGLSGLLLVNMTMPVTLHLLCEKVPYFPGSAFGFLTVAIFVGFLPVYYRLNQRDGYDVFLMFALSFFITLSVEFLVAILFGIRTKRGLLLVFLMNLLTNPMAVFIHLCGMTLLPFWNTWCQVGMEVGVLILEAFIYVLFSRKDDFHIKKPILLATVANVTSFGCGLFINYLK